MTKCPISYSTDTCCVSCFTWTISSWTGKRLFKSGYRKLARNADFNTWKLYIVHNIRSRSQLGRQFIVIR